MKLSRSFSTSLQHKEFSDMPFSSENFRHLPQNMSLSKPPAHLSIHRAIAKWKIQSKQPRIICPYLHGVTHQQKVWEVLQPNNCSYRHTRTTSLTASKLSELEPVKQVRKKLYERKEIQAKHYNKGSKELSQLQEGDIVRIRPKAHNSSEMGESTS